MEPDQSEPSARAVILKELVEAIGSGLLHALRAVRLSEPHPLMSVMMRAAAVRQHDALLAICDLVCAGRGDAAAALLRPACEELIVLTYLGSIDRDDAETLVRLLARRDIAGALTAQHEYVGPEVMAQLGLGDHLRWANYDEPKREHERKRLQAKLGWTRTPFPSVHFMAVRAGQQKMYKFLYSATSRSVHFNVGELMRRAWGNPDQVTVSTNFFERYWAAFSLSWGVHLYFETIPMVFEWCPATEVEDGLSEKILKLAEEVGPAPRVPIITAEELRWPV